MKIKKMVVGAVGAFVLGGSLASFGHAADKSGGVYPNDFGPTSVDVSHYPPKLKMYYRLFLSKCSACHTVARPLNSQFVQLTPEEEAAAKKATPEIFKNPNVWKIGVKVWSRYVHQMMSKPGSNISPSEGKKIFEFLVYDSKTRKTGDNAEAWQSSREKLLASFKANYPKDYARIFNGTPSSTEKAAKAQGGKKTAAHS